MHYIAFLAALTSFVLGSLAQISLFNLTTVNGLSSTCVAVLNQQIACDPLLLGSGNGRFESDSTLSTICTSACLTGLTTYARRVSSACGTVRYDGLDGYLYLPSTIPESIYERYQLLCLKDLTGKYCNAVIRDILHIDPSNQLQSSNAAAPVSSAACNGCFFSSISQILVQPFQSSPDLATAFTSLRALCKTTMTVTTPTPTTWSILATTTSTTSCAGTQYNIQSGDTCQSISFKNGISTSQMLTANGLFSYCSGFPKSGTICVPSSLLCKPYVTKPGDTCDTVASANRISWTQVVSWNPDVGSFCGNIGKLAGEGLTICVSNPGGSWVNPDPPLITTSSTVESIFTKTGTPMSLFPNATTISALLPRETFVTPYANGSKLDCELFMTPPVLVNATTRTFSYTCAAAAMAYGITVAQLLYWNPNINQTGGFEDPCELSGDLQYCIQDIVQMPKDTISTCVLPGLAQPGWTCDIYAWSYNITKDTLITWNPSLGSSCSGYREGSTYCAAVEHYRPPGQISTCSYWAMANDTLPADGPCTIFETTFKLTHGRFVAWNPSVKDDCSGMVKGYDYCIGTPQIHPGI